MSLRSFFNSFKYKKTIASCDESTLPKKVVSRFSRGNSLLQRGRYATKESLGVRIKELSKHNFAA